MAAAMTMLLMGSTRLIAQCPANPSNGGFQTSSIVGASFTLDGTSTSATYVFRSINQNPLSGVPGLIEYCVYPSYLPPLAGNVTPLYDSWTADFKSVQGFFSFGRPDGNPTNLPLDGSTQTIGTASWATGNAPSNQPILLHINDQAVCESLYGSATNPDGSPSTTCFVYPGLREQQPKPLTVSKDATPSFTRTFSWGISKSVDTSLLKQSGTSGVFNYTVTVTHDAGTDSKWKVDGTVTLVNPNGFDVTGVNVADAVDNGGVCTMTGGTGVTVPASSSVSVTYSCTYASAPSSTNGINTATATWDENSGIPAGSATFNLPFEFGDPTTLVDDCVNVTDTVAGTLGTVCSKDPSPKTFNYSHTVTGTPGRCTSQDNTATFTTNTNGATGSANQTVQLCVGADLTAAKTATPSFIRTYNWTIGKSVDRTVVNQIGGTVTFNYVVAAAETGYTDGGWAVTGTITVTNPNDWEAISGSVSDAVNDGGTCTIAGGGAFTIPKSGSVTLNYTCTFGSAPSPLTGTNTATASWDSAAYSTPHGSAAGTAGFAFTTPSSTSNGTAHVTDSYAGSLGTLTAVDTAPFTSASFSYSRTITVPQFNCAAYSNSATITETGQIASRPVTICGPAKTSALTMGFWQNKNGQAIITGGTSTGGVCNSDTWLRNFAPFQDLSTSATCTQVAAYVTTIIKAANASGASMNSMLKAQMLATALDVYFSDPALGGNKINALVPIGGVAIDLTQISKPVGSNTFENTSAAFGGATCLSVLDLLTDAAGQSTVGGVTWYGQVKATQELAKDTFDAINNQVAFGCGP